MSAQHYRQCWGFLQPKCLQNHSSLWRQQQKVHCCSYAPPGMLYKTEKETLCKVNITSPTHCCMHHEKSSVSAHRWNKISWFWWRAKKENVGLPRDCICRHNASGDIIIKLLFSLVISRAHEVPLQPAQSMLICIWMQLLVYQSSHLQSWAQIPSPFS